MERSDPVEVNRQMPTDTEERSRINRGLQLPSFFSSGLALAISTFCIGLVSGAAGGLLLGATAVVVLQSLELLADNRLLMDQLEKYISFYPFELLLNRAISQRTSDGHLHNIFISLFAEIFGVFSSTLSLAVGISVGLSTYTLVIEKYGEAAMGKALAVAGPVCLMAVTATGYFLGLDLERFLAITSSINDVYLMQIFISGFLGICVLFIFLYFLIQGKNPFTGWLLTSVFLLIWHILYNFLLLTKFVLIIGLIPGIVSVILLENTFDFQLTIALIPLMLIITDVFNIAGQPIVTLQSPTSTNTSSAVLEAILVGVLTPLLLTVAIAMSLFVSWQRGGAGKICVSAAGSGAAVLGVIKLALPLLGPGPTIGAVMGVAGAIGVSLSAAGAATDHYGQVVDYYGLVLGRLGVTVGAAVGAFLSSCTHSGLSGMFMALCAAMIPAGLYFKLLLSHSSSWLIKKGGKILHCHGVRGDRREKGRTQMRVLSESVRIIRQGTRQGLGYIYTHWEGDNQTQVDTIGN